MFEADGVDGGAMCKRGFTHVQFAEKPEALEAERHLGSWILDTIGRAQVVIEASDVGLLSNTVKSVPKCGDKWGCNFSVWRVEFIFASLQMQEPPRGGTWVGRTWDMSKSRMLQVLSNKWLHSSRYF
ncbi:hypothetical protein HZH66_004502 [Vespula vulgaris]|uniref:Uncharacterized protein n=1 Tax=Vespula vulgaris TaxID=7454 RepID=A0A834K977_VESVU|nr:hypothetical protein HZH66_004502 [Vespula vulgaris]